MSERDAPEWFLKAQSPEEFTEAVQGSYARYLDTLGTEWGTRTMQAQRQSLVAKGSVMDQCFDRLEAAGVPEAATLLLHQRLQILRLRHQLKLLGEEPEE